MRAGNLAPEKITETDGLAKEDLLYKGIEIVDGHMHLFTDQFVQRQKRKADLYDKARKEAARTWHDWLTKKYGADTFDENDFFPTNPSAFWAAELDRVGVDKAVFLAIEPEEEELGPFV